MLVTEVISTSVIRVIHYTGGAETPDGEGATNFTAAASFSTVFGIGAGNEGVGVVAEEIIKVEPEDLKSLELLQYPDDIKTFPAHMSIKRARDRLCEKNYGLFHNNCECFVNWAVTDNAISYQTVDGLVASAKGAAKGAKEMYDGTGGSVLGAIAGGILGIARGYQQHREERH